MGFFLLAGRWVLGVWPDCRTLGMPSPPAASVGNWDGHSGQETMFGVQHRWFVGHGERYLGTEISLLQGMWMRISGAWWFGLDGRFKKNSHDSVNSNVS